MSDLRCGKHNPEYRNYLLFIINEKDKIIKYQNIHRVLLPFPDVLGEPLGKEDWKCSNIVPAYNM
jgi:hypothetical protein